MGSWAAEERRTLVTLLRATGPDAPVVPQGWRTRELAAHLYVRERRPDAAAGVVLPGPFASYTDRVMASVLRVHGYDHVVDRVAAGPPAYLRPVDELINVLEYFVHTEDVRRPRGDGPRRLAPELEELMWARLRRTARMSFRRAKGVEVELVAPGRRPVAAGEGVPVRVTGDVGELVLFAFDRKAVAHVELSGAEEAVQRLRAARLGP